MRHGGTRGWSIESGLSPADDDCTLQVDLENMFCDWFYKGFIDNEWEPSKQDEIDFAKSIDQETLYMNPATGSVDDRDGWWYENEDGEKLNGVDRGEVVGVQWNYETDNWEEVG
ncbi:MAG: hypothetical protein M0P33_00125 [Massilibacteroides sp.]|nr:hypothetical protein [Massilibacteroides sp.]